jgi:hypothetical protein
MEIDLGYVTLGLSLLALVIAILGFFDSRNKTKIMKSQLKLLQEQADSKQDVRKAIEVADGIIAKIGSFDVGKYNWGDFGSFASSYLLEVLHDSGEPSVLWRVSALDIFGVTTLQDSAACGVRTFDVFRRLFEEMVPKADTDFNILFSSSPKIMQTPNKELMTIFVKDYVTDIYSLGIMVVQLKSVEDTLSLYDPSLFANVEEIYLRILDALYHKLTDKHRYELVISSKIKVKELPYQLLKFIAFDVWNECIDELRTKTRTRLYEVIRNMRGLI